MPPLRLPNHQQSRLVSVEDAASKPSHRQHFGSGSLDSLVVHEGHTHEVPLPFARRLTFGSPWDSPKPLSGSQLVVFTGTWGSNVYKVAVQSQRSRDTGGHMPLSVWANDLLWSEPSCRPRVCTCHDTRSLQGGGCNCSQREVSEVDSFQPSESGSCK